MKTKIRILFLGLKKSYWKRAKPFIEQALVSQAIKFDYLVQTHKWENPDDKEAMICEKYQPDFIFTSIEAFSNIHEFKRYFGRCKRKNGTYRPTIFLIEKELQTNLKKLWDHSSENCCALAGFGQISLPGVDALLEEVKPTDVVPIRPQPKLFFNPYPHSDSVSAHHSQNRFIPFSLINKIIWKDQEYNPSDFVKKQDPVGQSNQFIGIWNENDLFSLVTGFPLQNIISLRLGEMEIDHIITWKQLVAKGLACQAMAFKLQQKSLETISLDCNRNIVFIPEQVKNNVQIKIYSELELTSRYLKQILIERGYQKVDLIKQPQINPAYLLLNVSDRAWEDSCTTLHLPLEKTIKTLSGLPEWKDLPLLNWPEKEKAANIEKRYLGSLSKLKKLDRQLQIISNTKAMNEEKKGDDQLLFDQVKLLKQLLEMAEIWEDKGTILKRTHGKSAFVFYDSKLQLSPIMLQLKMVEKRYHFNVKKIKNLENLLQLDVNIISPFLDEGVLICCLSSKKLLSSQLHKFEKLLEERRYSSLSDEEKKLYQDRQEEQKNINQLISWKIWQMVKFGFQDKSSLIYQTARKIIQREVDNSYSKNRIKTICLASENSLEVKNLLEKTILEIFPKNRGSKIYDVAINLNLMLGTTKNVHKSNTAEQNDLKSSRNESEQVLLEHNIHVIKTFQRNLLKLIHKETDLLLWIGDISLLYQLITYIKQESKKFLLMPIIGIVKGGFSPETYHKIVESGARLLYWNQFNKYNPEYISQQLELILNSGKKE